MLLAPVGAVLSCRSFRFLLALALAISADLAKDVVGANIVPVAFLVNPVAHALDHLDRRVNGPANLARIELRNIFIAAAPLVELAQDGGGFGGGQVGIPSVFGVRHAQNSFCGCGPLG